MKQDLTTFSDAELSLIFMNDEYLYKKLGSGSSSWNDIVNICDEMFIYTYEQLNDLQETFNEQQVN